MKEVKRLADGAWDDAGVACGGHRTVVPLLGNMKQMTFMGISPFSIVKLAQFYSASTDYLLGMTEQIDHSNTELDTPHLSDDMIELLQNGRY